MRFVNAHTDGTQGEIALEVIKVLLGGPLKDRLTHSERPVLNEYVLAGLAAPVTVRELGVSKCPLKPPIDPEGPQHARLAAHGG